MALYTYDNLGRRDYLARPNGVYTDYGYDGMSRLASLSHDLAGTAHDQTWTYAYNPASQIVSRARSNAAYDWAGPAGATRHYADNGLNQLTSSTASHTFVL